MKRTIVIGAGLAGLTAALHLHRAGHEVTVIEARNRVGGRALSVTNGRGGIDLGPAWIWPQYQPQVIALLAELGLEILPQYEDGDFIYETRDAVQRGAFPRRYLDAARIRGGVQALSDRMVAALPADTVQLGQVVSALDIGGAPRVRSVSGAEWTGDAVICAVPGPIAALLDVTPAWPDTVARALVRWPTWMAAQAKVVAVFDSPFWRTAGLSGGAVSHVGPLVEIADQSDPEAGVFGLFGFVGVPPVRRGDAAALKAAALAQLVRLFGAHAGSPTALHLMDWADEPFTATATDRVAPAGHPPYGALGSRYRVGPLIFAGAEVSDRNGGLIEGAVETGARAARHVLAL